VSNVQAEQPLETGWLDSINVGESRTVEWLGQEISTNIFKSPVSGPARLEGVNVIGDDQADRSVHGGPDMAVYAYASEGSNWWADALGREIFRGTFGENLTTTGIDVTGAVIGEIWRIGDTILEVSQPRIPCYKLGIAMGDDDFPRRFGLEVRPGAYLRILTEGTINPGDEITV